MKYWSFALAAMVLVISNTANASLAPRLGGLATYDDVANLTWLTDANAAGSLMNWTAANAWALGLDVAGVTGWRLAGSDTCAGYNCTGSEMGNLFYNVLGNTASSLSNTGPFSNVQSYSYWSATEYAPITSYAWVFGMSNGFQLNGIKSNNYYAWAVQSGDVSAVPVPAAVWLFGSGLLGLIGFARAKER